MKLKKKLLLSAEMMTLLLILSGCMQYDENKNPTGVIYNYLVVPTGKLIVMLAEFLSGDYGLAIIVITIVVRLAIMPMNVNQIKKSMVQQEKMKYIKPELEDIKFRQQNAQTPEEKAAVSQEMMALYKENNISMTGGVGCLPILIQMPIFTAMYQAVNLTPEIAQSTFLGINLGDKSPLLAILAGVAYLAQGYVSTIGMPEETKSQMKTMMLMNPIMILMFSWSSPAGLALYWLAGGIFAAVQTLLQNHMIKPKIQQQVEEEMNNRPTKKNIKVAKPSTSPANQAKPATAISTTQGNKQTGRNAGKQKK